eukprot:3856412-Ditylum_brightwellii.AAC.1
MESKDCIQLDSQQCLAPNKATVIQQYNAAKAKQHQEKKYVSGEAYKNRISTKSREMQNIPKLDMQLE